MPFDSNGVFTRVMNWTSDQQNGIAIECGRHDQEDDNFAEGFNSTFCRDGRAVATGDFDLGQHKIKNLANGTASTDAVNKGQLDSVNSTLTAQIANTVTLTGTQTISGIKTILDAIEKKATWDSTQTPLSLVVSDGIRFKDSNDVVCGLVTSTKNTDGVLSTVIDCRKGNLYSQVRVAIDNNNNLFATAPGSDIVNSIVTTEGISKGANGYVKLGNGIIIQWGITPSAINADSSVTITLPTAFTSSNYSVSVCQNGTMQTGGEGIDGVDTKTTTSFTLNHGADGSYNYMWIAIGY